MSKTIKATIGTGTADEFFDRAREHARALDKGEKLAPEITIKFEDVGDLLRVLSAERVRLLRTIAVKSSPVSRLATGLKRDLRAVNRDVILLESFGLLSTRFEKNPGHGRQKIVEPMAGRYQLVAII
jgi:predicted transcriptional regulator